MRQLNERYGGIWAAGKDREKTREEGIDVRVHVDLEEMGIAVDATGVLVGLDSDGNVGMVHAGSGSSGFFIVGHAVWRGFLGCAKSCLLNVEEWGVGMLRVESVWVEV
jgi:hypothetical protein